MVGRGINTGDTTRRFRRNTTWTEYVKIGYLIAVQQKQVVNVPNTNLNDQYYFLPAVITALSPMNRISALGCITLSNGHAEEINHRSTRSGAFGVMDTQLSSSDLLKCIYQTSIPSHTRKHCIAPQTANRKETTRNMAFVVFRLLRMFNWCWDFHSQEIRHNGEPEGLPNTQNGPHRRSWNNDLDRIHASARLKATVSMAPEMRV